MSVAETGTIGGWQILKIYSAHKITQAEQITKTEKASVQYRIKRFAMDVFETIKGVFNYFCCRGTKELRVEQEDQPERPLQRRVPVYDNLEQLDLEAVITESIEEAEMVEMDPEEATRLIAEYNQLQSQ